MSSTQRVLVVSDLHTIVGAKHEDESYLSYSETGSEFGEDLIGYLRNLKTSVDIIVCPGDVAHKAEKKTFQLGWTFLNRIKSLFPNAMLVVVPGNHDYESRSDSSIDPKTTMQFADPQFPLENFELTTHFWAWNWVPMSGKDFNAILLNTSAYHGLKNETVDHGRVLPEIQRQILDFVASSRFEQKPINYLICHHHPVNLPGVAGRPDFQMINGGQELIDSITSMSGKGAWMIIHGHRHFPAVTYAQSRTSETPVVFSAGTVAAKLTGELLNLTRNQFYLLEIDLEQTAQTGVPVGVFESHEYAFRLGWATSTSMHLPRTGGFGSRTTPTELANAIRNLIGDRRLVDEATREEIEKRIKHHTPLDLAKVQGILAADSVVVELDGNSVLQVGRGQV